jgi:2-dehydro-3-deoxyphosphogluconate aldolase/(4S)-4-hydroxy-2-oxoglutarate aldolase
MMTGASSEEDVLGRLTRHRVVPVAIVDDVQVAVPTARGLVQGGLPVCELTFRTSCAADAMRAITDAGLTQAAEGRTPLLLGAGTVTDVVQVDDAVAAGARFIVSPGLGEGIVERCREYGVPVFPGTATATEVQAALRLGLRTVKFFPAATSGGPAALRALNGPFPQMQFIATGGITPANMHEYLEVPAVTAVGGSWMLPPERVAAGDVDAISAATADAVARAERVPA